MKKLNFKNMPKFVVIGCAVFGAVATLSTAIPTPQIHALEVTSVTEEIVEVEVVDTVTGSVETVYLLEEAAVNPR